MHIILCYEEKREFSLLKDVVTWSYIYKQCIYMYMYMNDYDGIHVIFYTWLEICVNSINGCHFAVMVLQ